MEGQLLVLSLFACMLQPAMNECNIPEKADHSEILARCIQLEMNAWNRNRLVTSKPLHFFVYKDTSLPVIQSTYSLSWVCNPLWALRLRTGRKDKRAHHPIVGELKHPHVAENIRIFGEYFRTSRYVTIPEGIAKIIFSPIVGVSHNYIHHLFSQNC